MISILHLANCFSEELNLPLTDCWVCFHHVVVLWCTGQDIQTLEVLPCSRAHYSCVLQHNLCQAGSAFLYQCGTFLKFNSWYLISLYSEETFLLAQFAGWNTLLEKNSMNTGKWKWSAQLKFLIHCNHLSQVGNIPQGLPGLSLDYRFEAASRLLPTAALITGVAILVQFLKCKYVIEVLCNVTFIKNVQCS
jgi:hypothetical protein